jgi:serine protease Do
MKPQKILLIGAITFLVLGGVISSGSLGFTWSDIRMPTISLPSLPRFGNTAPLQPFVSGTTRVVTEESVIIDAVEKVKASVVTVGIKKTRRSSDLFQINPFDPFGGFRRVPGREQTLEKDIGSGFIISADGLVVTNKHVVDDPQAEYKVILSDDTSYDVQKIYRDSTNDLAILKINASKLQPIELGDSSKIKVGQLAIAIGTALGEFRQTVTTGVISGVGRGIEAGSPFEGSVERLDNVIQTDAAINPGNSGGPLLNSAGQVIGVNTAVSAQGQNIGFAIPINVVKEAVENFNQTGQFNRPFLGVRYQTVSKDLAILNEVPEGAYIREVVQGSPAEKAGIQEGDIIIKIQETRLTGDNAELSKLLQQKKAGEQVTVRIWRDGKEQDLQVTLGNQGE